MSRTKSVVLSLFLLGSLLLSACAPATVPSVNPYQTASSSGSTTPRPTRTPAPGFLEGLSFTPEQARYFDEAQQAFALTPEELSLLGQNGFVVTDRLAFQDFTNAYGYIYWKDLPVVVTTDSLLQVVHHNYDYILMLLEFTVLKPRLTQFLTSARQEVKAAAQANKDKRLDPLYDDLEIYLTVPLALLTNGAYDGELGAYYGSGRPPDIAYDTPGIEPYLALAGQAAQMSDIQLFGGEKRTVDFTLFAPRGHYTEHPDLARYFRAMTWLGQVDFRFVAYNPNTSEPKLQPEHLAAAVLLRDAVDRADLRDRWTVFDQLLTAFVGRSDNMILPELDAFLADASLPSASAVLDSRDPEPVLALLTTKDYGQQRITGQVIYRHVDNLSPNPIPRPVTFALMGPRFVVDSYVMSNLVYDRLWVDGQTVERALPSTLDVMYILGNDRALDHLDEEMGRYGYQENLETLRGAVEELPPEFWTSSTYNRWLSAIRTLGAPTTASNYPQALRTAAWADKMLQTQLASWAQLRHDNLLYAKQSYSTAQIVCSYPEGYVEPYPEFYAAVAGYARAGRTLLESLDVSELVTEEYSEVSISAALLEMIGSYDRLATVADRLKGMAEKELRLEAFSEEEEQFIKSVVVMNKDVALSCGGPSYEDLWNGWYPDLFLGEDKNPALIADVHTNPTTDPASALYPPRVLHVATGPVATMFLIVDTDEGSTMYVGPAWTYFEAVEEGSTNIPPKRLNDEDWAQRLQTTPYPQPPAWTSTFRLPIAQPAPLLTVPLPDQGLK